MYAVIQNVDKGYLPSIVNMNTETYPDLIMAGYDTIQTGTKREMMELMEEMIMDYAALCD